MVRRSERAVLPHSHEFNKLLYCLRGSIQFELVENGERIELLSDDGIELPAGTTHSAIAGPDGVVCVEATARLMPDGG